MLTGVLLRNYKNYGNINFIPICDNTKYQFSVYIGNNGVGKSAVLESIDVFFNGREWNLNHGSKSTEAYICPVFLLEKSKFNSTDKNHDVLEWISNYIWNVDERTNSAFKSNQELGKWLEYKNNLKTEYYKDYYLLMIGVRFSAPKDAYFATLDEDIKKKLREKLSIEEAEVDKRLSELLQQIRDRYSYVYIPVESSPQELLQLQNQTMQKLLNKDLLEEIEKILRKSEKDRTSIVDQINNSLNSFIEEVNKEINKVESYYEFKGVSGSGTKKNLSAKDIREKVLEAYFPLRDLKVNSLPVSQLSSGEQRKAIIDVAYSVIATNGTKQTEKEIILGIDEPESSMHISNCFKHFQMLEELATIYSKQVMITTHWYGFLPVAHNGILHYIDNQDRTGRNIRSFSLYSIMEEQRNFPDAIELKSMFDLATSIITYMRTDENTSWVVCEGSDDKLYLECMLDGISNVKILPMGGCGNVVKLFRIIYSTLTEKNERNGNVLFIIDTDKKQSPHAETMKLSGDVSNVKLRRLQIDNEVPVLLDPEKNNIYEQTEIEDCLNPNIYIKALGNVIKASDEEHLKSIVDVFELKENAKNSRLRNDESCLKLDTIEAAIGKKELISFAEDDTNKKLIAEEYSKLCKASDESVIHPLRKEILKALGIKDELPEKTQIEEVGETEGVPVENEQKKAKQVPKKKSIIIVNNKGNAGPHAYSSKGKS